MSINRVKILILMISVGFFSMGVSAQEKNGAAAGAFLSSAEVSDAVEAAAYEDTVLETEGFAAPGYLSDGSRSTYIAAEADALVTVSRGDGIGGIYIEFDRPPGEWTLTDPASGVDVVCGKQGFLHEYVGVAELLGYVPQALELRFGVGTVIADIYGLSQGKLPDWVQTWEAPCEQADLLLLSTHSDDEQLFFAGMLPYYAVERGLAVQVAYVVQHFEAQGVENHVRPHEQLDGLWAVGIRNYPVMSKLPDLYGESKNRQEAFEKTCAVYEAAGFSYEDFEGYITECLRRFRPLVVVSHDLDGEYGHGAHVVSAAALTEAISAAADGNRYPESAQAYGVWQVEKTYLHLYEENAIVMDWDTPLESLGGRTAFQVSQEGFGCHVSQHWTWFYKWMYGTEGNPITKASQITRYSPCLYGLYDTQVGADVAGGDFFEHIVTYEERAAEEAARKEAAEEAARAAEARKAEEEAARKALQKEQEARAAEEAALREQARRRNLVTVACLTAGALAVSLGVIALVRVRGSRHGRK